MIVGWFLAAAILLVAFGGLMAAVDAAIMSQSRADIAELAVTARSKRSLSAIAADTGAHLNAINFVRIIAETTAAVLVTLVFATTIDAIWLALLLSALLMTAVSFVLVGASPRSVGRAHPQTLLMLTAVLVHFLRVLLGPVANALVALGNRVTPGRSRLATFTSEDQLLSMVDEATELDVIEEDDRELIHSIFEFSETVVRELMIPRTDMVTIDADSSVGAAMGLFLSKGFSRVPVVDGEVDDVTGILYLRDVSRLVYERPRNLETLRVGELAKPAQFVPESKKADALLRQMQLESNHLAMVVDEYGGIAGLVTLEDLIEELVGDISDEYDRDVVEIEDLGHGRFRVSARLPVDELGELFDLDLDDDEVDSVGGLLAKALGRLPVAGSEARTSGLILTAERTEGRRKRISTVLVEPDKALRNAQSAFLGMPDTEGAHGNDTRT
ncbi:hemolysin [Cryobacterium sp. LW097]|uniref:hemolysin family protein n=1 Tax=unclassified Cryobacterium TaxID=2649013 RepID=UPI000B4CD538|nr:MULTISPECIES: hemolysin family protein [unclassified Cryobacterium]ASD22041.1 hemolysin [Cryobacterium sp. LW097]TFC53385.1 HlyC/CorC family transporter [Cryobacterium sp. TMB3-1-2]TFC69050.1 HlyC/CorC family transporter [Cryobacterium sp. TMB3-15]TFC76150.1 HlyC/CorC family transporter [Cryobacterium sp. TMB3-10]TFD43845.1 HlyC/CorC family transporter [Cryobacterium sp. TMB3-12]